MTPLLANIILVVIAISLVGGILIPIIAILASYYRKMQRDDMNATLKMEMIQRGMSADEIERVLKARMSPPAVRHDWQRRPEEQKSRS
jgi:Na+-transporting NADH:ubiquinone oxidoreductase subunit NqrC